jgi:DNA replication protein DnaC
MTNPFLYIKEECEICSGKGYIWHNDTADPKYGQDPEQCECLKKMIQYTKLSEANVAMEYFDLTMHDFRPNSLQGSAIKMQMNNILNNFDTFFRKSKNMFLYGSNGTGKTMLSIELLKEAARHNYSIYYEFYPIIYDAFNRKGFAADDEKDRLDHIFATVDVLVLDEIGKEKASAYNIETSANLLEMHILKKRVHKKTILISNSSPSIINNTYNDTINSLLSQRYNFVHVDGTDFRGTK